MQVAVPVANGLSTDHPIPDLPFVDDSHIPTTDPRGIEAIGRRKGDSMWGRFDWPRAAELAESDWWAFTTDPRRTDLAWCVRFSPGLGRSVVLVDNAAAGQLHEQWSGEPLLFRAGGYWWDGNGWFRPAQLWDGASERFVRRSVPMSSTITAADLLTDHAAAALASILDIGGLDTAAGPVRGWDRHLAAWAAQRPADSLPLPQCVVNISAPELAGDQLVGAPELAEMIGVEPSALRTQVARGQVVLPTPQAAITGRNAWSRPVGTEWAEAVQRSSDNTAGLSNNTNNMPVGINELWEKFAAAFFARLWRPERRKRWVLRSRNEDAVREVADELATVVALKLDDIIPAQALAGTVRAAILQQFLSDLDRAENSDSARRDVALNWKVATTLDWLVRHHPTLAQHTVTTTIGDAERFGVPRTSSIAALRGALSMDGKLSSADYDQFFARAMPPADA